MTRAIVALLLVALIPARHGGAQDPPGRQAAIPGVIAEDTRVELVRGNFRGVEGPVASHDGGLFFSDVPASLTYKLEADGKIAVWRENTQGTNGLFLLRDGRLLAAASSGRQIVSVTPERKLTTLATACGGQPLRAPNDLIADAKGGVYFTDPAPRPAPGLAPKELGNVCYLRPTGGVLLLDGTIRRPNGLTLSLDERTLFVDDTEGEYVYAFGVLPDGGVANKREFVRLLELEQAPVAGRSWADGMAVDSIGRLYVATRSGIQVIDPRGVHLGTIRVGSTVRNLAFAGPRRQTLYVTGIESLYRIQMLSEGPSRRTK